MSRHQAPFDKDDAADPASCGVAPQPNGVHGGESRSNHNSLPTGNSPSEPSSTGDAASSSPRHHPPETTETEAQNHNADVAVTSTSPATISRDSLKEGQETVNPVLSKTSTATTTTSSAPLGAPCTDTDPPITSYIPPSRRPAPQVTIVKEPRKNGSLKLAMPSSTPRPGNMFFGAAHRRRNMANTNALTNYEADMNNKDRAKQKEGVQRFLDENIDDEWKFDWPRPANSPDFTFVNELGVTGREAERWKERDEWLSNTNDSDDDPAMPTAASPDTASPASEKASFKFESPDDVGEAIRKRELAYRLRRERKLKEELEENEGLRCFVARRDAWTGARRVKRQSRNGLNALPKPVIPERPVANSSTEDLITENDDGYQNDSSSDDEVTEVPIAPPLLPKTNPIRASITPSAYKTIYDKVVLQSLSPSCPVNLKDVMHSCVQGWKRDGEWPPKGTAPEPTIGGRKKTRKLSVASIFGLNRIAKEMADEKERDEGGSESAIRKSIQKIFGKGKEAGAGVNGNGNEHAVVAG